jgi:hypothetical protein
MSESEKDGKKPLVRTGESLGWMVGSTVAPKKARLIEGTLVYVECFLVESCDFPAETHRMPRSTDLAVD